MRELLNLVESDVRQATEIYTAGQQQRQNLYEKNQSIHSAALEYISRKKLTIKALAEEIDISRTTLSLYLNGKLPSDPTDLENKLRAHLKANGFLQEGFQERQSRKTPTFFKSADAENILGICQSCQEYCALGIIVGKSGYGKTFSLKQFAKMGRVCHIECDDSMTTKDLIESIERSVGIPSGFYTIWRRTEGLKDFFEVNKGYLLIIDEADKLISKNTQKKIEILRAIFDQTNVGIVLAGEPVLEAKLKSYLPRLANRVDFYVTLRGITRKEVAEYLQPYNFTPDALEEMYRRATNTQTGCFRLLDRTMKNILRVVKPDEEITLDVISEASNMMML